MRVSFRLDVSHHLGDFDPRATMETNEESAARVLIADDQADVLKALRLLLKGVGLEK